MRFDVFFSYAHEDKVIALELAQRLRELAVKVWIDESEMRVGDDLRTRIEHAFSLCNSAVVLLSPQYFQKNWTVRELNALLAREPIGMKVFPVWHKITPAIVGANSRLLEHRLAGNTDQGLEKVAEDIVDALRAVETKETSTRPVQSVRENYRSSAPEHVQAGGSLPINAVYVDRTTDAEMWTALQKPSGIATLTAPRSMGKSSLLARLREKSKVDRQVISLDCTALGFSGRQSVSDALHRLGESIASQMDALSPDLPVNVDGEKAIEAFVDFIQSLQGKFLITVDEANYLDHLFAQFELGQLCQAIIYSSLRRSRTSLAAVYWIFAGETPRLRETFTEVDPELGYHTTLNAFSLRETARLFVLANFSGSQDDVVHVHDWTGGQPYLAQWSAQKILHGESAIELYPDAILNQISHHFDYTVGRLTDDVVTQCHRALNGDRRVDKTVIDPLVSCGLLVCSGRNYAFANRLYEEFFVRKYGAYQDHSVGRVKIWLNWFRTRR